MNVGLGVALVVAGVLLALLLISGAWRLLKPSVAFGLLAACGIAVGAGGLLVQELAGPGSWIITGVVLAVLTPHHALLVFGAPGRDR